MTVSGKGELLAAARTGLVRVDDDRPARELVSSATGEYRRRTVLCGTEGAQEERQPDFSSSIKFDVRHVRESECVCECD